MTPGLTATPLPPRPRTDRTPRWEVRFEEQIIGTIEAKKIGKSSSQFYHAFVVIDGRTVNLELDIDFEGRAETILGAWRDPSSDVHTRIAFKLPDPS